MKVLNIIAGAFVLLGFGIIHSGKTIFEILGGASLGLGALYFIVKLIVSINKTEKKKIDNCRDKKYI